MKKTSIAVRLAGESYILTYNYGTLEDNGQFRYYYQGNISTQGIDIRLGKRVIASRQMDTIWQTARHNHFNEFVGELVVPDVPRGILTTTNSKTDFNLDDPDWETIFSALRQDYPPVRDIREMSEEQLRQEWLNAAGNGVWRGEGVD